MLHRFLKGTLVVNLFQPLLEENSFNGNAIEAPGLHQIFFEETRLES
jgi:hypothetical protein